MVLPDFETFIRVVILLITVETNDLTQVFATSAIGNCVAYWDWGLWVSTLSQLLAVLLLFLPSRFLVQFLRTRRKKLQRVRCFRLIRSFCELFVIWLTLEILYWSGSVQRLSNNRLNGIVALRAVLVHFTSIGAEPEFGRGFSINRSLYYLS